MDDNLFIKKCKDIVVKYTNARSNKENKLITPEDVHIVYYSKTLENSRVVMVTSLLDGMRYELTYNGALKIIFFDVYKKLNDIVIPMT